MTFKKVSSMPYADQHCMLDEYVHEESGLRHYHLNSNFPELVFSLSLPTPPEDDTGMPHILEHFTLSGGKKYPLKDPFMAMGNRSLAHQMNAMTSWVHTTYYFATTVQEDYKNMSDVYLDLVFNPLLRKADFEQEGWRLERDDANNWEIKGVVFNEMKGVYAKQNAHTYDNILRLVAPNTPLSKSSGGHPLSIPYLEYDRLLDFHRRHYTPQAAALATSGDIDISALHAQIEETMAVHLANVVQPLETPVAPPAGAVLGNMLQSEKDYLVAKVPGEDGVPPMIIFAYDREGPQNPEDELLEPMIFNALFASASSPLLALEQKWQCSIQSNYLFDTMLATGKVASMFIVNGLDQKDIPALNEDLKTLWRTVAENGVSANDWKFVSSMMLKGLRKEYGKSVVNVVQNISKNGVLGRNPLWDGNNLSIMDRMVINPPSDDVVRSFCLDFADNAHPPLSIESTSDLIAQWDEAEQVTVQKFVAEGRPPQNKSDNIPVENNLELLPFLNEKNVVIPKPQELEKIVVPSTENALAHTIIGTPASPTASFSIVYDVAGLNLSSHEKFVLATLSKVFSSVGSLNKTYEDQCGEEERNGVSIEMSYGHESTSDNRLNAFVSIHGNALIENLNDCVKFLIERTQGAPMLEDKHWQSLFTGMIENFRTNLPEQIVSQGRLASTAPYSKTSAVNYEMKSYHVDNALSWYEKSLTDPSFAHKEFATVLQKVLNCPRHVVTLGPMEHVTGLSTMLAKTVNGPTYEHMYNMTDASVSLPSMANNQFFPAALMINHCYRAYPGPNSSTEDAAAVKVALELIDSDLHRIVREEGGAYGVFAMLGQNVVEMISYRDPHVAETFAAFASAPDLLDQVLVKKDERALNESKLAHIKRFLVPKSVMATASTELDMLRRGVTHADLLKRIEYVRSVSWDDVKRVKDQWLSPDVSTITDTAAVVQSKPTLKMNR